MEQRGSGAMLPTVSEYQQRFGVGGVGTVTGAYNTLIDEGLVVRKDSPRRYFVVDSNAPGGGNPDVAALVTEIKKALAQTIVLVEELERTT